MGEIKAGVTLMQDFCRPQSEAFKGYIDYLDREEAQRNQAIQTFNLFNDYMGNPEKSTGLFTDDKNNLTYDEKKELKDIFETAQKNESVMWQTVISFDNRWLEHNALFDSKRNLIDESKLKEVIRLAVNRLLKSEGLEHAIWSAGIHYNTDNIHVQIATVEPYSMREKMLFQGKEEVRGKFKLKNIEACKSSVVNEIMQTRDVNLKINHIIREKIVGAVPDYQLVNDPVIRQQFLKLYESLPSVPRNLIHYNSNIMQSHREMIDAISRKYIASYHGEIYSEFSGLLERQSRLYAQAYGTSAREYQETKEADLMDRLANAVLKAVIEYEKSLAVKPEMMYEQVTQIPESHSDMFRMTDNVKQRVEIEKKSMAEENLDEYGLELTRIKKQPELSVALKIELEEMETFWENSLQERYKREHVSGNSMDKKYKRYFKELKEIRMQLNQEEGREIDVERLWLLLEKGEHAQNPFVLHQIGELYQYGRVLEINEQKSQDYFRRAFRIFNQDVVHLTEPKEENRFSFKSYVQYRIGKQYNRGLGVEKDSTKAAAYFKESGASYARYSLGELYFYGEGVEQDYKKAFLLYSGIDNFPFADLKRAMMYEKGLGIGMDKEKADICYAQAFHKFTEMEEEQPDPLAEYQLGKMLYYGQGCEADLSRALKFLEIAAEKKNIPAQYLVSKIYIEYHMDEKIPDAIKNLKELADKGNHSSAQYVLGKLYTDRETEHFDLQAGTEYLKKAAEQGNEYAQYRLGKIYLQKESEVYDLKRGISFLRMAVEQGNEPAKFLLGCELLNKESAAFNKNEGLQYIQELADKENQFAQVKMGFEYLKGENVDRNIFLSCQWFEKAAKQGNTVGREMLEELTTVPIRRVSRRPMREIDKALMFLKKSMYQEEVEALRSLREYEMEQRISDLEV